CCRRSKEYGRALKVVRLTPTASRYTLQNGTAAVRVIAQGFGVVGSDVARRNGIHIYAPGGPLIGKRLRKLTYRTLGCGITGHVDAALKSKQRRREDYFAVPTRDHVLADFPGK